jgi:tryptophan synthase alpha chain
MNHLETVLRGLRDDGRKGLIPFISAGDPNLDVTHDILLALDGAGASAIEVGVPFSDPIADGPVIQASSQRALAAGANLPGVLDMVGSLKGKLRAPVVLFSYLNPIDRLGFQTFAERSSACGASALLLTDAPPGVEPELEQALTANALDRIVLVAPTTPPSRIPMLASVAQGFVYVIARRGVTGAGAADDEAPGLVTGIREYTSVPVYVGFGVSNRQHVETIHAYADGAIVGSALVDLLHRTPLNERAQTAGSYLRSLQA